MHHRARSVGGWLTAAIFFALALPAPAADPVAAPPWWWPPPDGKLVIDLGAAGCIAARPVSTTLRIRSAHATFPVNPQHIGGICTGARTNSVTLLFRNGETLTKIALLEPLKLDTGLGSIALRPDQLIQAPLDLQRLSLSVEVADGILLTGEPSASAPHKADGSLLPWGDIQRLDVQTNAVPRFRAILSGSTNPTPVTLPNTLTVTCPYGIVNIPPEAIDRVLVLASADPSRPSAPLGNVALATAGAVAKAFARPVVLNDGDVLNYDNANGYASGPAPCDFTIQFPQVYNLSLVRILFWDRDSRAYRYAVDVSPDGEAWHVVADRAAGHWRSWQSISFTPQPARAIRVRGLGNSSGANVDVIEIEAFCHPPENERQPAWNSGVPDAEAKRQRPRDP